MRAECGNCSHPAATVPHRLLPKLRQDAKAEARREGEAEVDAVAALPQSEVPVAQSKTGFAGVHAMNAKRRVAHDKAIAAWEADRKAYYAAVEDRVLAAGRALREDLAGLEAQVQECLAAHSNKQTLLGMDEAQVRDVGARVESLDQEKDQRLAAFEDFLDGVEAARAQELGARLAELLKETVDIGHLLVQELERYVEGQAHEINTLVMRNRADAAGTLAELRKAAILSRGKHRKAWRADVMTAWRQAQHAAALAAAADRLQSDEFVNPPGRVQAVQHLHEVQEHWHEGQRMPIVRQLLSMRPRTLGPTGTDTGSHDAVRAAAADFTPAAVQAVHRQLTEVSAEEQRATAAAFEAVSEAQDAAMAAGDAAMGQLRWTLHSFSALAPPAGLPGLAAALRQIVESPDLEAVFRNAGGLRGELSALAAEAESHGVVQPGSVESLSTRCGVLLVCADILKPLEAAGREAARSGALDTLTAMRGCRRGAVPKLLATLLSQVRRVSTAPGLEAGFVVAVEEVLEGLLEIASEVATALTNAGLSLPDALSAALSTAGMLPGGGADATGTALGGGASFAGSARRSRGGMGTARSVKFSAQSGARSSRGGGGPASVARTASGAAASTAGSARSSRTAGRTALASQMTDRASAALGSSLPLAELRKLQRRLGMLLSVCDLPAEAVQAVADLQEGLRAQGTANAAVDAEIEEKVVPLLQRRRREGAALLRRLGLALQAQGELLAAGSDRLCAWMEAVAGLVERHIGRELKLNEVVALALQHAEAAFQTRGGVLESAFEAHEVSVAEAATEAELEARNATALQQLGIIEEHYRDLQATVSALARSHPVHVQVHSRALRRGLCGTLGVFFQGGAAIDGTPAATRQAIAQAVLEHRQGVWVTRMRALVEAGVAVVPEPESSTPTKGRKKPSSAKKKPAAVKKPSSKGGSRAPAGQEAEEEEDPALSEPADLQELEPEELAGLRAAYRALDLEDRVPLDAAVAAAAGAEEARLLGPLESAPDALDWGPHNMELEFGTDSGSEAPGTEHKEGERDDADGPPLVPLSPLTVAQRALGRLKVSPLEDAPFWGGSDEWAQPSPPAQPQSLDDLEAPAVSPAGAASGSGTGPGEVASGEDASEAPPLADPFDMNPTSRSSADDGESGGLNVVSVPAPRPQALQSIAKAAADVLDASTSAGQPASAGGTPDQASLAAESSVTSFRPGTAPEASPLPHGHHPGPLPPVDCYKEAFPLAALAQSLVHIPWTSQTQAAQAEAEAAARAAAEEVRARAAAQEEEAAASSASSKKKGSGRGKKVSEEQAAEEAAAAAQAAAEREAAVAAEAEAAAIAARERVEGFPSPAELEVYSAGVEDAQGTPLDPTGAPAMRRLRLEPDTVLSLLSALRQDLLATLGQVSMARAAAAHDLAQGVRSVAGTALEERLRRHWPRAGRLETRVREPRGAALLAHAQKVRKHSRAWHAREQDLQAEWEAAVAAVLRDLAEGRERLRNLEAVVHDQEDLARLQGVLHRAKQVLGEVRDGYEEALRRLQSLIQLGVKALHASNNDFLRTCVPFSEGGDWAVPELDQLHGQFRQDESALQTSVGEWEGALSSIHAAMQDVQSTFAQLHAEHDEALADLSLREGLGVKHGAPRRVGQEKVRTAFAWCETDERAISARLDELEALLQCQPGTQPAVPPAHCVGEWREDELALVLPNSASDGQPSWKVATVPAPLSLRIRRVLAWLRREMGDRGRFLDAFKASVRPLPQGGYPTFDDAPPTHLLDPEQVVGIASRAAAIEGLAPPATTSASSTPKSKGSGRGTGASAGAKVSPALVWGLLGEAGHEVLLGDSGPSLSPRAEAPAGKGVPATHPGVRWGLPSPAELHSAAATALASLAPASAPAGASVAVLQAAGVLASGQLGPAAAAQVAPAPLVPGTLPPSAGGEHTASSGQASELLQSPYPSFASPAELAGTLAAGTSSGALPPDAVSAALLHGVAGGESHYAWPTEAAPFAWPLLQDTLSQQANRPSVSAGLAPGLNSVEEALAAAFGILPVAHPAHGSPPLEAGRRTEATDKEASRPTTTESAGGDSAGSHASSGRHAAVLKGGGVGETVAFGAANTFLETVQAALDGVRTDTLAMFEREGKALQGEEDLPESLLEFCDSQMQRAVESRTRQLGRFRDQVVRLSGLLAHAPALCVSDVVARATAQATTVHERAGKRAGRLLGVLEEVRLSHEQRLVPQLADPNRREELLQLVRVEAGRAEEAKALLWRARREELRTRRQAAGAFTRKVLFNVAAVVAEVDALPIPADLAVVPGEEAELVVSPDATLFVGATTTAVAEGAGSAASSPGSGSKRQSTGEAPPAPPSDIAASLAPVPDAGGAGTLSAAAAGEAAGIVEDAADVRGGQRISLKRLRKRLARRAAEEAAAPEEPVSQPGSRKSSPRSEKGKSKKTQPAAAAEAEAQISTTAPSTWVPAMEGCSADGAGVPTDAYRLKRWPGVPHPATLFGCAAEGQAVPAWALLMHRAMALEAAPQWIEGVGGPAAAAGSLAEAASDAADLRGAAGAGKSSSRKSPRPSKSPKSKASTPSSRGKGAAATSDAPSAPPPPQDIGMCLAHADVCERLLASLFPGTGDGALPDGGVEGLLDRVQAVANAMLRGRVPSGSGVEEPATGLEPTRASGRSSKRSTPRGKGVSPPPAEAAGGGGDEVGDDDEELAADLAAAAALVKVDPFHSARGCRFQFPAPLEAVAQAHAQWQGRVLSAVLGLLPHIGSFVSMYSSGMRHAIAARDEGFARFGQVHRQVVLDIEGRYADRWAAACQWDRRWVALTKALFYHASTLTRPRELGPPEPRAPAEAVASQAVDAEVDEEAGKHSTP